MKNENNVQNFGENQKPKQMYSNEINLIDYIKVILKYKKMIIAIVGLTFIISIIMSLTIPNQYKADALISALSPGNTSSVDYTSKANNMFGGLLNLKTSSSNEQVMEIIKSRTMADYLINKFDLMKEWKTDKIDLARRTIRSILKANETEGGLIGVTLEYTDPAKAADWVNAAIKRLDEMNINFQIFGASKQRIFLEKRLSEIKIKLKDSEEVLKAFQEKHKIVDIDTQAASSVGIITNIQNEIITTETELGVKSQFKSQNDPEIVGLKLKLVELNKQLNKIYTETPKNKQSSQGHRLLPIDKAPEIGLAFFRLKREVKIQEAIFQLLVQQYELAKINETKNTPTITIIDRAVAPQIKSKPKRKSIVLMWTFGMLFLSLLLCFVREYIKNYKEKTKINVS